MQSGSSDKGKSGKGSNEGSGVTGSTETETEKKDKSKSSGSKDGGRETRSRFFSYSSSRGRGDRGKNRGRGRDDYVYSRSRYFDDRKVGFRGRYNRRGRDDDTYGHRSRYQESLKPRTDVASSTSKFYCSSDHRGKTDINEDSRISTTLRRMAREEDDTVFNNLCNSLQNSLTLSDNEVYIRRSLDSIDESLLDMIRFSQKENFKLRVSKCLGHVGYNLGKDFHRYMEWIFRKINNENSAKTREFLLKGILELAHLDSENPKLGDFSKHLIKELHTIMESTDIADIYMLTAETILILTKHYPYHFAESFHDTIDIIVGWHIDGSQPPHIAEFSSQCLRSLSDYWIQDIKFTVSLLTQILEDAQIYSDEVSAESNPIDEPLSKTTSFIRVFRAVFEGAKEAMDPSKCKKITWAFHSDAITQIFNIVLKIVSVHIHCPVICAGNYCALAIMEFLKYKTDTVQTTLFKFIGKQLDIGNKLDNETVESLLALIAKVIGESGFKLPGEMIDRLFSSSSIVLGHRFTSLRPQLIALYQALLKRKDVKLFKSAFSHMISDLSAALKVLFPNMEMICSTTKFQAVTPDYDENNAEIIIKFYLDTFQIISKTGGAIFWIYLVKPSLFELFAVRLVHLFMPLSHPSLFHSVVVLLRSHCSKYGEFVPISELLKDCPDNPINLLVFSDKICLGKLKISPTAKHLSVIMKLVGNLLKMVMSEDTKLVLLLWAKDILSKIKCYYLELHDTEELSILMSGVTRSATDRCRKIALASAKCIYIFADNFNQTWKMELLIKVMNLCTTYVNSVSKKLQAIYLRILKLLPSLTIIFGVQHYCKDPRGYKRNLESSLYASMTRGDTGEIQDIHFRKFMEYIFHGYHKQKYSEKYNNGWLEDLVSRCWAVLEFELGQRSMSSERALLEWGAWQCANLTINQRLKTPIGKPAETLVAIENAITDLSKEVVSGKCCDIWRVPMTGQRVRILFQFVENLEKLIYNAVEGTAYAFQAPPQSVKSFFITNKGTCVEWLNRVRLTLMFVCLHAGLASYTIRHGQAYLQHLIETNNTQSWEFRSGVMYVAWALSILGESEAVSGMYAWSKEQGVKIPALKPLSLKAARRYEEASEGFRNLIASASESELSQEIEVDKKVILNCGRSFIADHLTECYLALNNWEDLSSWKRKEKDYLAQESANIFHLHKYLDEDYVEAMKLLEIGERDAAVKLLEWKETTTSSVPAWNHYNLVYVTSSNLFRTALSPQTSQDDPYRKVLKEKVKVCRQGLDEVIKESLKESTSELFSIATVLKYVAASLSNNLNHLDNQVNEIGKSIRKRLKNPEMSMILWWSSVLKDLPRKAPSSHLSTSFNLMLSRVSRKEGNYNLARVCLLRYLNSEYCHKFNVQMSLLQTAETVISISDFGNSPERMISLDQLTKLLKTDCQEEMACDVMIERIGYSSSQPESRAKCLVNLAQWIQNDSLEKTHRLSAILSKQNLQDLITLSAQTPNEFLDYLSEYTSLSEHDTVVKSLLRESLTLWPGLAKAWVCMAEASYSWARNLSADDSRTPSINVEMLPLSLDYDVITSLIIKTPPTIHLDDIDVEAAAGVESFEIKLCEYAELTDEDTVSLIQEWRKFHTPVYNYFKLAAYSYFKFLQHYSDKGCVVLATLRLVRLLVKYPEEMVQLYQEQMSETPTSPWVCVVPQLFSRLSHPHLYPRRKITELLVRIGTDYPHLISFPAVVGSKTGVSTIKDMPNTNLFAPNQTADDNGGAKDEELDEDIKFFEDEEEPETYDDDEANNKDESTAILENSFITIVESLSKLCGGNMLNEVGVLVSELRRITVLWDELWLGTLKHRHADTSRRFSRLSSETEITLANQHLSQETKDTLIRQKHSLILKPLLFVLEQLHSITSVPPETPHELQFQEKYSEVIEETLKALREPTNPQNPEEACSAVKRLEKALSGGSDGKPSVYSMTEISPILAGFKDTCVAMPGLDRPSIMIKSVIDSVQVLATMTKPKKLIFVGSDGKEYTYLFKGLEDLHLDERIMQFLSTANSLLRDESLKARHYSVVPLGPRSGLISWVDSVTPIFSIYKRWQQRDQQPNSKVWYGVARPSELYYSVLTPLLTEAGFKADPSYRSTWPMFILKKALSLLTMQTPNHLLSKEIWCYSGSGGSWWESTKLYSTSLGVMSMIGYIIGLGDRHLDNVMVNLRTGQVVHIDYNVCFEKGKTLRIPEKVPYRLTPNLIDALGITALQGLFRSTCEKVLGVLQREKETLLTLLEAFVYDPLIDWTPLNETGYTGAVYGGGRGLGQEIKQNRRQLERQVTLAMFSIRVIEISHQWRINKDKVGNELSIFIGIMEKWMKNNEKLNGIMSKLQERHSQMALLKEAEGQPNHPIYTLGSRYETFTSVYGSKQLVISSLTAKLHDADLLLTHYQSVIEVLRSQELSKYLRDLNSRPKKDLCTVFDLIKEFLLNAGQNQMVLQCVDSESQMCQITAEQNELTANLIELLSQYWEIARNYPVSYFLKHRSSLYKKWALLLLEDMSPQNCAQVEYEMSAELCLREDTMVSLSRYYADLVRLAETTSSEALRPLPVLPPLSKDHPVSRQSLSLYSEQQVVAAVCNALISINCQFLCLESAASGAGEYLVNLMSREGSWFLEDMVTLSCIVQELITLLPPPQPDSSLHKIFKTLSAIDSQYKALQEMDLNLRGIILFEAMQSMRCEEPTVVLAASVLENLTLSSDVPLAALTESLYIKLKMSLNPNMKLAEDESEVTAGRLQQGFATVMSSLDSTEVLSPGQMLLLGFNGLFSDLEINTIPVSKMFASLDLPSQYHCIDHIADSKQYPVELCDNERGLSLLPLYLSVCRIQAMAETMGGCSLDAEGWRTGALAPADPSHLARPVRSYIANYVRSCLLGLLPRVVALAVVTLFSNYGLNILNVMRNGDGSLPNRTGIEEFCNKFIELKLGGKVPAQLVKLVDHVAVETRRNHVIRVKERESTQARASLARQTLLTTAFYWLHEHYLLTSPPPPINRAHFMLEVRKTMAALLNLQVKINDAVEQQQSLINSSEQRLRWASGANPALTEVLSAFENSVTTHRQRLMNDQRKAVQVSNFANWVLQYEALRTPTNEALNNDTAFAVLVKECSKCYFIREQNQVNLSSVEEGLVALVPSQVVINHQWIASAEQLVSESIRSLNKEVEPLQKEMFAAVDSIKTKSLTLRYDMGTHNKIISDIRELFKTMIKFEDAKEMGLENYLFRYKEYTDKISRMTKWFTTHEPFSEKKIADALQTAQELLSLTDDIYEDMLKLSFSESPQEYSLLDVKKRRQRTLTHTKSVQEKNSYAIGVWRRIKLKLEGRDPDPGVTSSISQQVNWTINEAMSFENLSTLYEGWTPWV